MDGLTGTREDVNVDSIETVTLFIDGEDITKVIDDEIKTFLENGFINQLIWNFNVSSYITQIK